jgi:hypothetical protein
MNGGGRARTAAVPKWHGWRAAARALLGGSTRNGAERPDILQFSPRYGACLNGMSLANSTAQACRAVPFQTPRLERLA